MGGCGVSRELKEEIAFEQAQLRRLAEVYGPLLAKSTAEILDPMLVLATAAVIHSFYGGAESIMKQISIVCDGRVPEGAHWHRDLLITMGTATANRPALLQEELQQVMRTYLDFRHVFRTHYGHLLQWPRVAPLACTHAHTNERFIAARAAFAAVLPD